MHAARQPSPNPSSTPPLPRWAHFLVRRRLVGPALLMAASHRPLAFVAGQTLLLLDPLVGLLGIPAWDREARAWADLLSDPAGLDQVTAALAAARRQPQEDAP